LSLFWKIYKGKIKMDDKKMMVISIIAFMAWPFVMAEKIIVETCQNLGFMPKEKETNKIIPPVPTAEEK
jgi:hypothetical protein